MSNSFAFFDIIIFAIIAVLLVYRLQGILGKKTGFRPKGQKFKVLKDPSALEETAEHLKEEIKLNDNDPGVLKINNLFDKISSIDPKFNQILFLKGAMRAFEVIVAAFASGDRQKLKPLLGDSMYQDFTRLLDERNKQGHIVKTDIISLQNPEIIDVSLDSNVAKITVKFISEQISYTMKEGKKINPQDSEKVVTVVDEWTFSRNLQSKNPNWTLVETS
jgi:predicted lipid-binding transport protein (Tim44 family)|tara:strand:- start:1520 stop:2176 length:657 start_codon:yes stop_codon:yes gene_type:complete